MDECVAARYKKVKLFENVYIYIFKDIVRNVEYDVEEDTINYVKNGKKKVLYDITDPDFTVSDEKYGFSDFFEIPKLCEYYDTDNIEEAIVTFESECKTFFRFGIIDEEKQDIKLISSPTNKLLSVEGDSTFIDFSLEEVDSYGECVFLPIDSINVLINNLKNKKTDIALAQLNTIKNISDTYGEYIEDDAHLAISLQEENIDLKDIEKELASLIGLDNVKKEILKLKKYLEYLKKVEEKVNLDNPNLNMVFKGNPGTGKTTVAKLIGKMLYGLGYAKSAKFKETTAQDFIGEYVGQTGPKARNLINECKGGVILIDEAYVFASPGQEFAQEALVEIIKEMEKKETIFIFAGYKDEMKKFIDMNPGLKSRIGFSFDFKDYTNEELFEIFERKRKRAKIQISDATKKEVVKLIKEHKGEDKFGNARYIDQLFEKLIINHAYNVKENDSMKSLKMLHLEDTKSLKNNLQDTEKQLNSLVGLDDIKKFVLKLKAYLEYLNKVNDKVNLSKPNLNMVFTGNPGTGKTTIARIISQILYKLEYVDRTLFKETTAQDFIAGYVGQTSIKTKELLKECRGGVILIDEAYALADNLNGYAQEALVEILKEMENRNTIFIFAGYTDEMKKFIDMNPGLKSRIGNYIDFKDYTTEELYQILLNKLTNSKLKLDNDVKDNIIRIIEEHKGEDKFGNGRFIDQLFDIMIRNHAYNCSSVDSINKLKTITKKDLEGISEELKKEKVKKLGF